jgi:hypothetical protein
VTVRRVGTRLARWLTPVRAWLSAPIDWSFKGARLASMAGSIIAFLWVKAYDSLLDVVLFVIVAAAVIGGSVRGHRARNARGRSER